jgi:hypothetical protein
MTVAVGSAEHDEAARGYAKFTQHLNSRSVDRAPDRKYHGSHESRATAPCLAREAPEFPGRFK